MAVEHHVAHEVGRCCVEDFPQRADGDACDQVGVDGPDLGGRTTDGLDGITGLDVLVPTHVGHGGARRKLVVDEQLSGFGSEAEGFDRSEVWASDAQIVDWLARKKVNDLLHGTFERALP
jgi:hypothetical protein